MINFKNIINQVIKIIIIQVNKIIVIIVIIIEEETIIIKFINNFDFTK